MRDTTTNTNTITTTKPSATTTAHDNPPTFYGTMSATTAASPRPFYSTREVEARRVARERQNGTHASHGTHVTTASHLQPNGKDSSKKKKKKKGGASTLKGDGLDEDTSNRSTMQFGGPMASSSDRKRALEEHQREQADAEAQTGMPLPITKGIGCCSRYVIFPWNPWYRAWWAITVVGAVYTVFFETYLIAFTPAGYTPLHKSTAVLEYLLKSMFIIDIIVQFNLAYYGDNETIVYGKKEIAQHYLRTTFAADLIAIAPIYIVLLAITGELQPEGNEESRDSDLAQWLSLVRLVRLVRFYKVQQFFQRVQYDAHVSLIGLTLLRNFGVALVWSHIAACTMYFIARKYNFDPDEAWIGPALRDDGTIATPFERYVTSLYWSIVTLTSVGYGDYSPVNFVEQIWAMIFMLLNIILNSWIIGSITLLIVKNDEKAGNYRESLQDLNHFIKLNRLDSRIHKRLKMQLHLEFQNREISDEHILSQFPNEVRRKVLRRLYLPCLARSSLMRTVRQQFVDAFLSACRVEIFSPGEELLQRGVVATDLYLIVVGTVKLMPVTSENDDHDGDDNIMASMASGSMADMSDYGHAGPPRQKPKELHPGNFINDIGFLTESPEVETVRTKTICKTLTMSRAAYKMLSEDHPGSVGKILQNLLAKAEQDLRARNRTESHIPLPKGLTMLRAGSVFDKEHNWTTDDERAQAVAAAQAETVMTSVQDLIKMHMNKLKDDHTTRFLFAASRGDVDTITLMCDQGFDPNSSDYDYRTALMVASMKGNTEAVTKLLEYHANPNLVDMHGTSALYEATRKSHEETMDLLLEAGGELCMDEGRAASTLCQAVFESAIEKLRRLLKANININAVDYDKRAAVHIAAAEGNLAALKILVEHGADLTLKDRWGSSAQDEAERVKAGHIVRYIKSVASATDDGDTNTNDNINDNINDNTNEDDDDSEADSQT